tara:strand:+ start:33196 stop:34161 length:966 start_codon:yes stop_codon:yes gene_type:complete
MLKVTTLSTEPAKFTDTLSLIEKEFGYSSEFSFKTDFAPLMQESNFHNLYILLDNDEVVGHTGLLLKEIEIGNTSYTIGLIGGVVIKSTHQGKGYSKLLLDKVCENKDISFYLLWSDKTDYYKKFNFYPCIQQFQYEQANCQSEYERSELTDEIISELQVLYNNGQEIRFERTPEDWQNIKKITSTDLYLKKENGKAINYFFINKGQDLQTIIHEYHRPEKEMLNFGYLWTPTLLNGLAPTHQYAALLRVNNIVSFKQFIKSITNNSIEVENMDNFEVAFKFNNQTFKQNIDEFLTGVFGPSRFEELEGLPYLYISGLDSI